MLGSQSTVKLLIEDFKVNVHETGFLNMNAFIAACAGGKTDSMLYLGDKFPNMIDANPYSKMGMQGVRYGCTALTLACVQGTLQAVRLLFDRFKVGVHEIGQCGTECP